jgi:hypothetical protein
MFIYISVLLFLTNLATVHANPIIRRAPITLSLHDNSITAVTALSSTDISNLAPFTQFARAAYCNPEVVQDWTCGEACDALPGFQATLTGGDGNAIQNFFVGHWPDAATVVVAHQGTDPLELMSVLTDLDFVQDPLDPQLFPGAPDDISIHGGFVDQHAISAVSILNEVKRLLTSTGSKSVTLIGHSLGGALAELDCLFMKLNLPDDIAIKGVTFGTPRVGNQAFVDFFDSKINDFQRVNNGDDIVPIVPGRFLGFSHPKGEVHLISDNKGVSCPGNDDDADEDCQIKTVPNVVVGNILDHLVYNGIPVGSIFCT